MSKYARYHKHRHLYGKQRWRNMSKQQLLREPLCCMCQEHGLVQTADVADHIIPHHGDEQLFWFGKLQSLCHMHHDSNKQQIEKKGYVNDIGVDGFPVDGRHPFNQASE
jgi:5-methylcytosine-specific restriction enzyme A